MESPGSWPGGGARVAPPADGLVLYRSARSSQRSVQSSESNELPASQPASRKPAGCPEKEPTRRSKYRAPSAGIGCSDGICESTTGACIRGNKAEDTPAHTAQLPVRWWRHPCSSARPTSGRVHSGPPTGPPPSGSLCFHPLQAEWYARSVSGDEHGQGPSRSSPSSSDHGRSSQGQRSRSREPTPPQLMNFSIDDFTVVSHTMDSFMFTSTHPGCEWLGLTARTGSVAHRAHTTRRKNSRPKGG